MPDVERGQSAMEGPVITSEGPLQTARPIPIAGGVSGEALGSKERKMIAALEAVHPLYAMNEKTWQLTGDVALNRIETSREKRRYLPRGRSEQDRLYNDRVRMSVFLPETPGLTSDFVGAVFSKAAKREIKKDEEGKPIQDDLTERVTAFHNAAGLDGEPISKVMQQALRLSLTFGVVDGFLDHPTEEEGDGEGTETPNLILYTAEQRLDWCLDDRGLYKWVKYRESFILKESFDGEKVKVDEYRIITAPGQAPAIEGQAEEVQAENAGKGTIQVFRVIKRKGKAEKLEQDDPVHYQFSTIPVRSMYWDEQEGGIGNPWVKPMAMGDIKVFSLESDLRFDVFMHAHPYVKFWLRKKEGVDEINFGGGYGLHLDPGNTLEGRPQEQAEYMQKVTSDLMLQQDEIKFHRELIRTLAGNGSNMLMQGGGSPQSGVALAYEQAQRSKNFLLASQALQEFEWQLSELVANEFSDKEEELKDRLEITYPDRFDQRLVDELNADLVTAKEVGSPTLIKEVKKLLAARLLGDGATSTTVDKVNQEIESAEQGSDANPFDKDGKPKEKKEEDDDGGSKEDERGGKEVAGGK